MAKSPILKVTLGNDDILIDISDMVESFEYTRSMLGDDTVEIEIAGEYVDSLIEHPACRPGSAVTFSYGYIGEGMTNKVTLSLGDIEPEYTNKGSSLSLTSVDVSQAMKHLNSQKVFQNMKPTDMIKALADIHGITAVVQTALMDNKSQEQVLKNSADKDKDTKTAASLATTTTQFNPYEAGRFDEASKNATYIAGSTPVPEQVYRSFPQGNKSNFELLQYVTTLLGLGYVAYIQGGKLYVAPRGTNNNSIKRITRFVSEDLISFKIRYKEINNKGSEQNNGGIKLDPTTAVRYLAIGKYHLIGEMNKIWQVNPDGSRTLLNNIGGTTLPINSTKNIVGKTGLDYYKEALLHPNMIAFLLMIRKAEGTEAADGHTYLFGSSPTNTVRFSDFSKHPNIRVPYADTFSTAAGAYQIVYGTDQLVSAKVGSTDFSPVTQDLKAVTLLGDYGVVQYVLEGLFDNALRGASKIWASLPYSDSGQPHKTIEQVTTYYTQYGGQIKGSSIQPTITTESADVVISKALKSVHNINLSVGDIKRYLSGKFYNSPARQFIEEKFATAQEGVVQAQDELLTATLRVIGDIRYDVNTVITMAGFCTLYNGNWYVRTVKDAIDDDGFISTLELTKGQTKDGVVITEALNPTDGTDTANKVRISVQTGDGRGGVSIVNGNNPNSPKEPASTQEVTTPEGTKTITVTTR